MGNQHPITPPPDQVQRWEDRYFEEDENLDVMLIEAYQAGADQELEACCQALYSRYVNTGLVAATAATVSQEIRDWLRAARRPKPPSLKEQALKMLRPLNNPVMPGTPEYRLYEPQAEIIRRALEQLDD